MVARRRCGLSTERMGWFANRSYGFGCGLAALVWPFFRARRRISVDNILRAGITADPREARRIAAAAFRHFAGHIAEALFVPSVVTADNWREHLDCETDCDPELSKLILETPDEPILMVSAHHGVWEAATNVLSLCRPMYAVAKIQKSKWLARWMKNHHFRGPVTIVGKDRGFRPEVLRGWQADRAAMTILMDQYTYGGSLLRFFGRPARTFTSAARLAIRTGAPVAVGSFVRVGPFRYRLVGGRPLRYGRDADRDQVAQQLNDRLEAAIRKYPEQYLWMHRRWRDD